MYRYVGFVFIHSKGCSKHSIKINPAESLDEETHNKPTSTAAYVNEMACK